MATSPSGLPRQHRNWQMEQWNTQSSAFGGFALAVPLQTDRAWLKPAVQTPGLRLPRGQHSVRYWGRRVHRASRGTPGLHERVEVPRQPGKSHRGKVIR
jgi:hypothetical protein